VANATTNELLINSIQEVNENDMPILGRQFLSAAMLLLVASPYLRLTVTEINTTKIVYVSTE